MALALTGRRRAAAAAVSVLAAVAIAGAVVGRGCRVTDPGPEAAVRSLIAATNAGDRRAVFGLLSPGTQASLEERAQRATELVGSNVRYTALDLIAIGSAEDVSHPTEINVVTRTGDRALVEIVSSDGRGQLQLIRVDGRWRVDLPSYGKSP
jgi:hypothetical protein